MRIARIKTVNGAVFALADVGAWVPCSRSGLAEELQVEDPPSVVLGITAVNDISNPDRASLDPRNFEGKGSPDYTPMGPWIEAGLALDGVCLEMGINGQRAVSTGSEELPASISECIAYVTAWLALGPGDVIMTGAPKSAFEVTPGDLVEIDVAGIPLVTPCT